MRYSMQHDALQMNATRAGKQGRNALFLAAGAAFAASALMVRLRTRQAERDHPPLGEFIDVAGTRLHYVERGEGPPLVFLHGNGSMIQDFASSGLIDMAAKNHRVIAFDRPGYGYSERPGGKLWTPQEQAELLHRALLYLGVEQPVVVGHSWGTLVAVALALDYPEDVKGLVLMSGYYYPTLRADVPFMSLPALPLIGGLMRHTVSPWLARMAWPAVMRRMFGPAPTPARFSSEFPAWLALRPSQLHAAATESALMIPSTFSLRHRYHELTMPVVIMAGNDDRHVDLHSQSERLHQELPQSTFHVTRGAGHMLHHCAQDQILDAIAQAGSMPGAVPLAAKASAPSIGGQLQERGPAAPTLLH